MSKEREPQQIPDFIELWINKGDKEKIVELRGEFKSIRTVLSTADIKRIFPDTKDKCPYVPYITTPSMIEEFVEQWDPQWEEEKNFSLAPMLVNMSGLLKEATASSHKDYSVERGFYRVLMISNLIHSNWRPEQRDNEAEIIQARFNRDFIERLKRFVKLTNSDTWAYFADQQGLGIWTTAQSEVLAYMETESPIWRKILQRTRKDLRERELEKEMDRSGKRLKKWEEDNWSAFRS